MTENVKKRVYNKKSTNSGSTVKNEKIKTISKPVGRPKQSLARVGTKAIARTVARRTVTSIFGNGLLGSIMNAVVSTGIRQTDKIKYNEDFGVFHTNE